MENIKINYLIKIAIIGNCIVGKTNLLTRYVDNSFSFSTQPTVGVDFFTKNILINKHNVKIQLWDI